MKKGVALILFATALLQVGCYSDDDFYNRNVRLRLTDAVSFSEQQEYTVGDTLVFELKFSRYLEEEGYDTLLDVFETTGSEEFGYMFDMARFSEFSDSFERIGINDSNIIGARVSDDFSSFGSDMAARLDADRQEYVSKVGVILVETGRFRVDLDFLELNSGPYYDFDSDTVNISIRHEQSEDNRAAGEFTVIENTGG